MEQYRKLRNNILEYLEEITPQFPDKTAYADNSSELTFAEVYEAAGSIGTVLANAGAKREPVAILMKKSPQMVAAFYGCVYASCMYVPLDDKMPDTRIKLILETCGAKHIILDGSLFAKKKNKLAEIGFSGTVHVYEDMIQTPADRNLLAEIRSRSIDTDPIYLVFTSGSTGVPKGVAACHRSVIDYVENLSAVLKFDKDTVFGNQSPFYFDACLKELYPTMMFGCTTYIIPKSLFMFPVKLIEFLNEKKINTICWVASALTLVSSVGTFDVVKPKYLRTVAFGSEVFPIKQFRKWREVLPGARFINLYGPTECTGMSCYYEVTRDFAEDEKIPIGRPFKNTDIMLLDAEDRLVEKPFATADHNSAPAGDSPATGNLETEGNVSETGEIVIRGTCVTLGYYNNPEKTKEAFVQNPLNPYYPELVYRTGDIGRYNADGELVFVSRKDYQIKHMGHRIELGEIEAAVSTMEEISMCACVYDTAASMIVLYFTGNADSAGITLHLKQRVPSYMLPGRIEVLTVMPLTENGKINRRQLKEML